MDAITLIGTLESNPVNLTRERRGTSVDTELGFTIIVPNLPSNESPPNRICARLTIPVDTPTWNQDFLRSFRAGDKVIIIGHLESWEQDKERPFEVEIDYIYYQDAIAGIYALLFRNGQNGRYNVYLSQSQDMHYAWRADKQALRRQTHPCQELQTIFTAGQMEDAHFVVLKEIDPQEFIVPDLQRNERYLWQFLSAVGATMVNANPADTRSNQADYSDGIKYPVKDPELALSAASQTVFEVITQNKEFTKNQLAQLDAKNFDSI